MHRKQSPSPKIFSMFCMGNRLFMSRRCMVSIFIPLVSIIYSFYAFRRFSTVQHVNSWSFSESQPHARFAMSQPMREMFSKKFTSHNDKHRPCVHSLKKKWNDVPSNPSPRYINVCKSPHPNVCTLNFLEELSEIQWIGHLHMHSLKVQRLLN